MMCTCSCVCACRSSFASNRQQHKHSCAVAAEPALTIQHARQCEPRAMQTSNNHMHHTMHQDRLQNLYCLSVLLQLQVITLLVMAQYLHQ